MYKITNIYVFSQKSQFNSIIGEYKDKDSKMIYFLPIIPMLIVNFHAAFWLMFIILCLPYLAEYLLIGLLHHRIEDFNLGIDIQSIEFSPFTRSNDVKEQLHKAIDEIIV